MNLIREALAAARLELVDAGIPSTALPKLETALAALEAGQAVTTADVEAWAATADVWELGQAAFAIRRRVAELSGKLDAAGPRAPFILAGQLDEAELEAARSSPAGPVRAMPASAPLEMALDFARSADVDQLEALARVIRERVAGVADELATAAFQ